MSVKKQDELMWLYVDETENDNYFFVVGLLVKSDSDVDEAYKQFKKSIKGYKMKNSSKNRVYNEFKSTLLDKMYQKIKRKMLQVITSMDCKIIFSAYRKSSSFRQSEKESTYIDLLKKIVSSIDEDLNINFDEFRKKDFEDKIISDLLKLGNVISVKPCLSEITPGIQFVDNLCSVIRRSLFENKNDFFQIIEEKVIEV